MTPRADAVGHKVPMSPTQRSIWFLDRAGGGASYNIARARLLRGSLDVELLRASHRAVVARHEILRTRYLEADGVPVQVVDPPGPADFAVVEVGDGELADYLASESQRRFDLARDQVWRCRLIEVGPHQHVLLDVIHHIAADGWSVPLMRSEVGLHYNALQRGDPIELAPAVQFREIVTGRTREDFNERVRFWQSRMAGAPDQIALPGGRQAGAARSWAGTWVRKMVPGIDTEELGSVAGALDATPSMIGLSVFAVFLARYSGAREVVIGVPVTGRSGVQADHVVGPFFNSLPIRIAVEPASTLQDLVVDVRRQLLDAIENELPFDEIVRAVAPGRASGQTPLFQVMYQYRDPEFQGGYGLEGVVEEPVDVPGTSAKFDLLLEVGENRGEVELSLNAATEIFDATTVSRMADGIAELASQLISSPDRPLGSSSIASPSDRGQLAKWLVATNAPLPVVPTLFDEYRTRVRGRESDVAIIGDVEVTHDELLGLSEGIASQLEDAGVVEGSVVALQLDRSPTMVAAILAVNRLRAVYVPIDPNDPPERVDRILQISGATVKVTDAGGATPAVTVERASGARLVHEVSREAVYMMFTSGSTGDPKGVLIGKEAIVALVCDTDYVSLQPGDVVAHMSNVAFDASTFEIWGSLLNGATMVIIPQETVLSLEMLERVLRDHSVTTVFVTTAMFNLISRQRPALFSGVRDVLFGGETCDPDAVRRVMDSTPPARLLHVYGPTETTTFASWYEVPRSRPIGETVPIGRPVDHTSLYVLDSWGGPILPGLTGELWIGGPGVAIGYVGDASLTHERFVPDPFTDDPWGRMYRTGDLARITDDGYVDFVGRADRQVKLRGFRIELEEVEGALRSHPRVDDAVVRLVETGDRRLVAWAATQDEALTEADIKSHLRTLLPEFMVPTRLIPVRSLPIGPTGKIDAGQLPTRESERDDRVPQSDTELAIVRAFEDVLKSPGVLRSDDFFELGGHSILVVELVSLIERRLGARLGVMEVIECGTPAEIARRINTGNSGVLGERLVEMADGVGPPLYVFHHPSGTVRAYADLVAALPEGVRVIGVNALGVDGTDHPATNLSEMAAEYATLLLSTHKGPFRLIGHSLGGLLAWETGRQLMTAGHEVDFLGLIDTQLPRRVGVAELARGFPSSMTALPRLAYERMHRLAGDVRWGSKRIWYDMRGRNVPADLARIGLIRAASKAYEAYEPRPVDTDVVYFLAAGSDGRGGQLQPDWEHLATSIDVVPVPGMHSGPDSILFPPNVGYLAERVSARLRIPPIEQLTTESDVE